MKQETAVLVRKENKNHEVINAVIMAIKERICYEDRLMTHNLGTVKSIIEGRMNVEKYLEKKADNF